MKKISNLKKIWAFALSFALMASLDSPALAETLAGTDPGLQNPETPANIEQQVIQADINTVTDQQTTESSTGTEPTLLVNEPISPPGPAIPDPEVLADNQGVSPGASTSLSVDALAAPATEPLIDNPETSNASSTASSTTETDITNLSEAIITNEAVATSTTGSNKVESQDKVEDAAINTGDINVYANVLNVVNTNLYDSKITELMQNFDSLSADLFLNNPDATSQELAQDLVTKICTSDVECQSLSSFTLTNQNLAGVQNSVAASGDSGNNGIAAQGDVKDSTISTGDVNAVVNVINIVNSNLVNSRWTLASINIFGKWKGDLVLPSELYFSDYMAVGTPNEAAVDLETVKKVVMDAQNDNDAVIINDVNAQADTGNNGLDAVGTGDGKGGDIHDSEVQTGQAQAASNVENHANTNIVNTRWYLNLINTLGAWSGNVYNLPDQVAMSPTLGGLSFFSTTGNNNQQAYQAFADAITSINGASTTASSTLEATADLSNENTAVIVNDVDAVAKTGNNGVTGSDVKRTKILTGNAKALANIINFANTNLIGSDLQIGLVNVFGDWDGNIVFGFPDLAVNQNLSSPKYPKEKGENVDFKVDYSNLGDSSGSQVALEWQYDPLKMKILSSSFEPGYSENTAGVLHFDLGKLNLHGTGSLDLHAKTLANLDEGAKILTYARIAGYGPERDKTNNESFLESLASQTIDPGSSGNGGGGGNDNGNNNGGSNPGGGGSGNGGGSNGGNGGGSSGGGGSGSSTWTDLLKIKKTNNAAGEVVKPGDSITFTLVIDNDDTRPIGNVIVYDTLRGPDNSVVLSKSIPLGTMQGMEEVSIYYDLALPANAQEGTYINSAYVEALNASLTLVRSAQSAISTFSVKKTGTAGRNTGNGESNSTASTTTPLVLGGASTSTPVNTAAQFSVNPPAKPATGQILGASTAKPVTPAPKDILESLTEPETANAQGFDSLTPPQIFRDNRTEPSRPIDESGQFFSLFFVCFLIALGYATANLIGRMKRAETNTEGENVTVEPLPPEPIIPNNENNIIPMIPVLAKRRGRPKKQPEENIGL